ncbi:hypothetical protein BDW66DRAFT_32056 [Aspergillus desertorum]
MCRIELLKAYRAAHSRVLSIEPFEAALRENTPLASIADPKALTEYFNQISLKGELIAEELKRVTTERDDFKNKWEETVKSEKAARDELDGFKQAACGGEQPRNSKDAASTPKQSPKETKQEAEEFFSIANEIPRLESELKDKQEEVESLKAQTETLKRDLSVARESTEGMVHNLEFATRELAELRDFKDKQEAEMEALKISKQSEIDEIKSKLEASETAVAETNAELEELKAELKQKAAEIEQLQAQASKPGDADQQAKLTSKLDEVKQEKEANEKRLGVLQGLVDNLRTQLKETQDAMSGLKANMDQKTEDSEKLKKVIDFLDGNLEDNAKWQEFKDKVANGQEADFEELRRTLAPSQGLEPANGKLQTTPQPADATSATGAGKKKNKKKKKGKGGEDNKGCGPRATT